MKSLSTIVLIGLPVTVSIYLAQLAHKNAFQLLSMVPSSPTQCSNPPKFEIGLGYGSDGNALILRNGTYRFQGASWLQANLCSSGILEITAYGEVAAHEKPVLVVILNNNILTTWPLAGEENLKLKIPNAGRLILGYFNDYYQAEVRVATLSDFASSGSNCQTVPTIESPSTTGGKWYPEKNVAALVYPVALKAVPCGPGQLSFILVGREAGDAFPQLSIIQAGKVLATPVGQAKPQRFSLTVGDAPVEFTLINPYAKVTADRNLAITQLKFSPTEVTLP